MISQPSHLSSPQSKQAISATPQPSDTLNQCLTPDKTKPLIWRHRSTFVLRDVAVMSQHGALTKQQAQYVAMVSQGQTHTDIAKVIEVDRGH